MDPHQNKKDVLRCDLCETAIVQSYCDICYINLCKPCVGEHISNEYDKHKIVPFQQRQSILIYPNCTMHPNKSCELRCVQCNEYICTLCSASDKNKGHDFLVLEKLCKITKNDIKRDIKELEEVIYPTYDDIVNSLENQIANLDEEYKKLKAIVTKREEEWHRTIVSVVNKLKNKISEKKIKHSKIL